MDMCFSGTELMSAPPSQHHHHSDQPVVAISERCYVCKAENSVPKKLPQRPADGVSNGHSLSEALLVF